MKDKITKRSSIRFSIIERINYYFSDPLKKHNNSIESVMETEKQSKEAAPLSDFLSSHKGDNSPPVKTRHIGGFSHILQRDSYLSLTRLAHKHTTPARVPH